MITFTCGRGTANEVAASKRILRNIFLIYGVCKTLLDKNQNNASFYQTVLNAFVIHFRRETCSRCSLQACKDISCVRHVLDVRCGS